MRIPGYAVVTMFALFGSPLGAAVLWLIECLPGAIQNIDSIPGYWEILIKLLINNWVFSYLFGLFPSIFAGFAFAMARLWDMPLRKRIAWSVFVGFMLTAAVMGFVGGFTEFSDFNTVFSVKMCVSAGLAAFILSGFVELAFRVKNRSVRFRVPN